MFSQNRRLISALVVLCIVVLLFSFGQIFASSAFQTEPPVEYEEGRPVPSSGLQEEIAVPAVPMAPGTNYHTFSGTRFQPTSSSLTYSASGGAVYATALPAGGYSFSIDFDLPAGATITEIVFFVIDNDATNFGLSLRSYNPETDQFSTLESASSSGASTTLQTIVIPVDPEILVDYTTTSYRLRVAPGIASSAHLLRGARIGYTLPTTYLPVIKE